MGHCAPTVMQTLLDASDVEAELVKLSAGLPGGIGNTGAECGGITAPLVLIGLRHARDPMQDGLPRVMPAYEVVERHHVRVDAPAAVALAAAQDMDLLHSPLVRAIIKGRELILGAKPDDRPRPQGLLAEVQSLGWGVLAEVPGHEIVVGGVTKPWEANPTFRALPPDEFRAFSEPDCVKIVWTLRADPVGAADSIFRTETRVLTTDPAARVKFRRYWSFLSPGIILIRWISLGPLKAEAERRVREGDWICPIHSAVVTSVRHHGRCCGYRRVCGFLGWRDPASL
jgi:hypothetical protein